MHSRVGKDLDFKIQFFHSDNFAYDENNFPKSCHTNALNFVTIQPQWDTQKLMGISWCHGCYLNLMKITMTINVLTSNLWLKTIKVCAERAEFRLEWDLLGGF